MRLSPPFSQLHPFATNEPQLCCIWRGVILTLYNIHLHKSAETICQAHQYAFRIWLIHAASWQALSAVPRLICQAVPVRIVFQMPARRIGHAANFQEPRHKQPFHGYSGRYSLPYSCGNWNRRNMPAPCYNCSSHYNTTFPRSRHNRVIQKKY